MNAKMKKIKINLSYLVIIGVLIIIILSGGCTFIGRFSNNLIINDTIPSEIAKIQIDENELKNLDITNKTLNEKIDTSNEIKITADKLRDPFMPFYLNNQQGSETQKNKLFVEKIYSENEIFYAEINFNDAVYKLKKDDLFGKIYQVKAINADSVVLLKGDELITIYINEIYYD